MPSKLLIAPADVARRARHAGELGVDIPTVHPNGEKVMNRVRAERDRFVGFVVDDVEALGPNEMLRERVTFTGPNTLVSASGKTIRAGATVVATGSTIIVPGMFRALTTTLITSDSIFELKTIPRCLAVIGGGIIGLELGQAMAALGAEVTLFDSRTFLGPTTDPKVSALVVEAMGKELTLFLGGSVTGASEEFGIARLSWTPEGHTESSTHAFDAVLVAVGRAPNVRGLGLELTGAELDARDMPRFDSHSLQVGRTPLFIVGDANGSRPLLHEAADEGRIAGRNAADYVKFGPESVHRYDRRTPLAVAFSHPQIALVGLSFDEAVSRGAAVGEVSFHNQGRARVQGENFGIMRIYGEKGSGRLLGAEMCCPGAEHMAHLLAWAVQSRMTVIEALEMPFYHPVLEEGLRTALRDLAVACGLGHAPPLRCRDCGPGA